MNFFFEQQSCKRVLQYATLLHEKLKNSDGALYQKGIVVLVDDQNTQQ
jgi:hypothetical protein